MLQKVRFGDMQDEVLTIHSRGKSVIMELVNNIVEIDTKNEAVAKELCRRIKDKYTAFRLRNATFELDMYEVLGALSEFTFICRVVDKYEYCLQVYIEESMYTASKIFANGQCVYIVLDSHYYYYLMLTFEPQYNNNLGEILQLINTADKESRYISLEESYGSTTLSIYTNKGVYTFNVGKSLVEK